MSEKPGPILVAGARGNQGGAALRHLLVRADYDDRTSLDHAPSCGMPSSLTGLQVLRPR